MAGIKKKTRTKTENRLFEKDLDFASTQNASLVEKKHQQIVDGAFKIFVKKGYHPTTIREIAKACGMSMGQLYHYISSKDDVLYLVHKHMQKIWYEHLRNSAIEKIEDPLERLTKIINHTMEMMVGNKKLFQFIYTESKYLDKKHLQMVLDMDYKNVVGFWRESLEELNKKVSVQGDLDFLASLFAYILVFLPLRGWTLKGKSIQDSKQLLKDFMLRGLGVIR